MKRHVLFSLLFLLKTAFLLQAQTTFNQRLHFGYPTAVLTSVVATDSCYYATGLIADTLYPHREGILFVKFDLDGNVVFQKTVANPGKAYKNWANTLIPLEDGGFALSGYTIDTLMKAIFIRYDSGGDTLFTKEYFNPYYPVQDYFRPYDMKHEMV